jgi:hypothetical protein
VGQQDKPQARQNVRHGGGQRDFDDTLPAREAEDALDLDKARLDCGEAVDRREQPRNAAKISDGGATESLGAALRAPISARTSSASGR